MRGIRQAAKQAAKSTFNYRLGAIVVKGGRILSSGYNVVGRSSSLIEHRFNSIHAEQSAILKLLKLHNGLSLLRGSTLYVTRILKDGSLALAKPCPVCMDTIRASGIKQVVYSIDNETQGVWTC